jgi:hypothetical protein
MTLIGCLFGAGIAATLTLGVAACSTPPPGTSAADVDAAYGIPPGTVPANELRPDGLLLNGLLPLPPNSGS